MSAAVNCGGILFFMTERKIIYALNRFQQCRDNGFYLESLLNLYHLNINILRFIALRVNIKNPGDTKPTELLEELILEADIKPGLKSIIAKKNLKTLRPWLAKMDLFFKQLKRKQPSDTKVLLQESEHIFTILKISATKLFHTA